VKDLDINEEEFVGFAKSYFSEAFPNPQQINCPLGPDLKSMAEHPSEAAHAHVSQHLTCCSPCRLRGNSGRPKEVSESRIASHRDLNFWIADYAEVDGDKPVCEDSSFLVREKTRARLLQSSGFHHLCRII
jgi:hypothetical protein